MPYSRQLQEERELEALSMEDFKGIAMDAVKRQLSARTGEFQDDEDIKKWVERCYRT